VRGICLSHTSGSVVPSAGSNVWKHGRKAIHTFLTPEALEGYLPTQQAEYVQFLYDVLNTPQVRTY